MAPRKFISAELLQKAGVVIPGIARLVTRAVIACRPLRFEGISKFKEPKIFR
jgi:hypothetical protein